MNRHYAMHSTLPYFIPFPSVLPFTNILINPFGTLGAVIQMRGMIPNRKALFDIGAAGPLAGFVVTLPLLIFGIARSTLVETASIAESSLTLGDSLLFKFLVRCLHGNLEEGTDLLLHPTAYAAWAGLLVTAINLVPIGQLDGGHILYSVFGPRAKRLYLVILALFGGLVFFYPGWALLFALLLWFGRKHPAPVNDITPIDPGRKILAGFLLFVFIISFIPVPFKFF
ncbi:site-2 protease family protein [candidate division KSB1 bacterium]|nr:site-2 protease family protein [candidate division KSB1 bacterium]